MSYLVDTKYLSETLTEDELYQNAYDKSKSEDSRNNLISSLKTFNLFTTDMFSRDKQQVLKDLIIEYKKNRDTRAPLIVLKKFKEWLGKDHENVYSIGGNHSKRQRKAIMGQSMVGYLNHVKTYFRLCGNIKTDTDDFRDLVSVKIAEKTETEADPVTREELKIILRNIKDPVRRAKYMFMKCTASRHLEAIRIQKKNIDFTKNPVKVTFPKKIVKGKHRTRYAYLDSEAAKEIKVICDVSKDDDFIFRKKEDDNATEQVIRSKENTYWLYVLDRIARENPEFTEINKRGTNGRLLKRVHSIRSFAMKCVEKGNQSGELADAYSGHRKFVGQYLDKTENERIEIFKKSENFMLLYSEVIIQDNEELKQE